MEEVTLFWDNPVDITRLRELLDGGEACIGSSDTVMGLMAPLGLKGHIKLDFLKNRSKKPYIVLAGSIEQVGCLATLPKALYLQKLLDAYWPGPLTVILKGRQESEEYTQAENRTVAVRVPNHPGLLALLQGVKGVFSTSANKAGGPIPNRIEDVDSSIRQSVGCIITEREGKESITPSTIIDCSQEELILVREGAISFAELTAFVEKYKKNV